MNIPLAVSWMIVAYLLLANGHDCLVHNDVRLYGFVQNVYVSDFTLYEQCELPIISHITSS